MKFTISLLANLVMAIFIAIGPAQAQGYRLASGDLLRVEVLEDTSLNREVLVDPSGNINLPLAGVVRAGGRTVDEVEAELKAGLRENFAGSPTVLVSLVRLHDPAPSQQAATMQVYIIGEVNKPGMVPVSNGTTLLQSLSLAGGVTDFAATKRIQLRRQLAQGGEQIYTFDYDKVLKGQPGIGTNKVTEGDVIVIPTRRLFE